jgi:4-diphosphocytidyl-2-C-methyl-D-erythritol kinase
MSEAVLSLPSFAKINLHLQVIGRRADGFHDLCTVFQTISLHDKLTVSPGAEIRLTCGDEGMPLGEENLVVRAAMKLRDRAGVSCGAVLHLEKMIPAPGGLGGGSSNAALALLALNKLWNLALSVEDLHSVAASLGSDVPFFLSAGRLSESGVARSSSLSKISTPSSC